MTKKLKVLTKAKDIIEANIKALPVEEAWYKERIAICRACEFNTANGAKHEGLISNLIDKGVCTEGSCTACGCCTDKKASLKRSVCGLSELEIDDKHTINFLVRNSLTNIPAPKWSAIELGVTSVRHGIKISHEGDTSNITLTKNSNLEPELNVRTSKEFLDLNVVFDGAIVKAVIPSCSCTVPIVEELTPESYKINLRVSTKGFRIDKTTTRFVEVEYYTTHKKVEKLNIYIKVFKTND